MVSEKYSFKGWSAVVWAKKNKNNLKLLASALLALITPLDPKLQVVVGLGSKLLLDALDYWLSD